jgi:uridine kinase
MKYAIIMPAGSGKSTFVENNANIIKNGIKYIFYDIDYFTKNYINIMKKSCCESMITNNWEKHNLLEHDLICNDINNLPDNSIILLHCIEKAYLYNLQVLDVIKINKKIMYKVAEKRGIIHGKWHKQITINNWCSLKDAKIYQDFDEIENRIFELIDTI